MSHVGDVAPRLAFVSCPFRNQLHCVGTLIVDYLRHRTASGESQSAERLSYNGHGVDADGVEVKRQGSGAWQ